MKTIATLIATLVATAAFAAEPAKTTPAATAAPAVAAPAPAKCDPAKDKTCIVAVKKAEVKPVKSQAPAAPVATKAAEPAKK